MMSSLVWAAPVWAAPWGVGGSVDSTILSHQTLAQVQSATVAARNQVAVKAAHTAATQQIVVGAAGGGAASLSLSGNVLCWPR